MDQWGQDVALDRDGQARVAANGELMLTDGPATGVQDIGLRLTTPLGSLFYDTGFGSLVHEWIFEESTEETRAGLVAELILRTELDPRVVPYSARASILAWNDEEVVAPLSWRFIGEDQPYNLILQADKSTKELVIQDAKPNPDSLSALIPHD